MDLTLKNHDIRTNEKFPFVAKRKYIVFIAVSILLLQACNPEPFPELFPKMPNSNSSGIEMRDSIISEYVVQYRDLSTALDSLDYFESQNNTTKQVELLQRLAEVCRSTGNYTEGLAFYNQALNKLGTLNDNKSKAAIHQGLAAIYYELFIHNRSLVVYLDSARNYAQSSYKLAQLEGDPTIQSASLNIMGAAHIHLGHYDSASRLLEIAMEIAVPDEKNTPLAIMSNQAFVKYKQGLLDEAMYLTHHCIQLSTDLNNIVFIGVNLENMARIYRAKGDSLMASETEEHLRELVEKKDVQLQNIYVKKLLLEQKNLNSKSKIKGLYAEKYFLVKVTRVLIVVLFSLFILVIIVYYLMRQYRRLRLSEKNLSHLREIADKQAIHIKELEIKTKIIESKILKEKLESRGNSLNAKLMTIANMQELLASLQKLIHMARKKINGKESVKLLEDAENLILKQNNDNWGEEFEILYSTTKGAFIEKLENVHPGLTSYQKRLAYLILSDLNTKEIALVMRKTYRSVEMARHRLRKKLKLDKDEKIFDYLRDFSEN